MRKEIEERDSMVSVEKPIQEAKLTGNQVVAFSMILFLFAALGVTIGYTWGSSGIDSVVEQCIGEGNNALVFNNDTVTCLKMVGVENVE